MKKQRYLSKFLLASLFSILASQAIYSISIFDALPMVHSQEVAQSSRKKQDKTNNQNSESTSDSDESPTSDSITDFELLKEEDLSEEIEEIVAFFEDITSGETIYLDDYLSEFSDLEQTRNEQGGIILIDFLVDDSFRGQLQFDGDSEVLQNYYFQYLTGNPQEIEAEVMEEARDLLENEEKDTTLDWEPNAYVISPFYQERNFIAEDMSRAINVIKYNDNNQLYRVYLYNYESQPVDESIADTLTAAVITDNLNSAEDYIEQFGPPFYHIYDTELNTRYMVWVDENEQDYLIVEINLDNNIVQFYSPAFEN